MDSGGYAEQVSGEGPCCRNQAHVFPMIGIVHFSKFQPVEFLAAVRLQVADAHVQSNFTICTSKLTLQRPFSTDALVRFTVCFEKGILRSILSGDRVGAGTAGF